VKFNDNNDFKVHVTIRTIAEDFLVGVIKVINVLIHLVYNVLICFLNNNINSMCLI
jgi:hypothetical protein